MITENLSTLKIHKLTKEQYERVLETGNVDENAWYLTPDVAGSVESAVLYTPQTLTEEQQAQARENIGIDKLCPAFTASGSMVTCQPVEGYPLGVVSKIEPVQSGSGDPSPENIRPISGHTEVKLWRGGLNLWDEEWEKGGINTLSSQQGTDKYGTNDNSTTAIGNSIRSKNFIPVKGGVALQICAPQMMKVVCYDTNKKGSTISYPAASGKFTPGQDGYIRFVIGGTVGSMPAVTEYANNICISVDNGSEAVYEPYKSNTFTLDFGQTVYGGTLDWNTGVLTVTRYGVTFTGDEQWKQNNGWISGWTNYFAVRLDVNTLGTGVQIQNSLCSHFQGANRNENGVMNTNYGWFCFNTNIPSLNEWRAWLAEQYDNGTPVTVCYEPANPTTIQLTPQEITALSGINTLYSDTGDTEVTGKANPAAIIEKLTNAILSLGGKDGVGITKTEINDEGELVITLSDNSVNNLGIVVGAKGEKGDKGEPGNDAEGSVLYTLQTLTPDQQAQASENIGVSTYYHTTREEVGKAHTDADWAEYIYSLYRALPGVVEKETKSDDGTFTNYEYVISTGEYSTDGTFVQSFGADSDIKKQKHLISSGVHGSERNAALSVYRFIRDVLNGHNVPHAFKEGVILHVLPVGNPNGFDAFTYENADGVNINRNFTAETKAKETQAIINWLKANKDAALYIDVHNGSALNEIVAILGDSDHDSVNVAKKIALKGVDRVIPYWKDVIGYPSEVEAVTDYDYDSDTGIYSNIELGYKPVIYSYCADTDIDSATFGYASNELSIPSVCVEVPVYYGDYSDYNPTLTIPVTTETYPAETIAAGAEAIGNILLEFYEQSFASEVIDDMKEVNGKLDLLLQSASFHIVKGTEYRVEGNNIYFPISEKPKFLVWRATEDTQKKIANIVKQEADASKYFSFGGTVNFVIDYDIASTLPNNQTNAVTQYFAYYSKTYYAMSAGRDVSMAYENGEVRSGTYNIQTEFDNGDGTTTPAVYEWTAYCWDE